MQTKTTHLCYHPSAAYFIDDEVNYLKSITICMEDNIVIKTESKPQRALDFLLNDYVKPTYMHCAIEAGEEYADQFSMHVDLREIHQHLYNPDRFNEISVLVVDYAMPSMDGLTLCEKLVNKGYRIIMLTGEAGINKAVDAFNQGIIHHYLPKNTPNLTDVLNDVIHLQQHLYFMSKEELIFSSTLEQAEKIKAQINDPGFNRTFHQLCVDNNIVEYYLLNAEGDYLLIDNKGDTSILACKSEKTMNSYEKMAEFSEAPQQIIEILQQRSKVPFFYSDEDLETPPEQWADYLYPAETVNGDNQYYYSLIKPVPEDIEISTNFLSYDKFLYSL